MSSLAVAAPKQPETGPGNGVRARRLHPACPAGYNEAVNKPEHKGRPAARKPRPPRAAKAPKTGAEVREDAARISREDRHALALARRQLEQTSLAARVADRIGAPIEAGLTRLPEPLQKGIALAARRLMEATLHQTLRTLPAAGSTGRDHPTLHRWLAGGSGFVGGWFGLPALLVELPVTTGLILRSVAEIAQAAGENLADPEVRLECLSIFAHGGPSPGDDSTDLGYFATRAAMARLTREAARQVASTGGRGVAGRGLTAFVRRVAERVGVQIGGAVGLKAVPVLGALGGSFVNVAFMEHYQLIARGHFTVRRLERKYGEGAVRQAWDALQGAPDAHEEA